MLNALRKDEYLIKNTNLSLIITKFSMTKKKYTLSYFLLGIS